MQWLHSADLKKMLAAKQHPSLHPSAQLNAPSKLRVLLDKPTQHPKRVVTQVPSVLLATRLALALKPTTFGPKVPLSILSLQFPQETKQVAASTNILLTLTQNLVNFVFKSSTLLTAHCLAPKWTT